MAKIAELETELGALKVEYAEALEARRLVEEELATVNQQKQDSARRQSVLESKIIELETLTGTLTRGATAATLRNGLASSPDLDVPVPPVPHGSSGLQQLPSPTVSPVPPPPPPPPCPPPMPVPTMSCKPPPSAPVPPPPAGLMQAPDGAMTIKRKVGVGEVVTLIV